jgi:pimeloyl-ACP methyl ester carboxylesterase
MRFDVPAPHCDIQVALDDGATIHVRRHGNPNGPRVVLSHGNGFAINGYFPYWQHLIGRFDVLLFDFRNYGENLPTHPANQNYPQLSRDLQRVIQTIDRQFGQKRSIGIFHSMSARTAMNHALDFGWAWAGLVLFDPPNIPPRGDSTYAVMEESTRRLIGWARRRRSHFDTIEELTTEYLQSRATARWVSGAHELMARSVLRRKPNAEGHELVCNPENEAAIYEEEFTLNLWRKACEFGGPVKLIGCDPKVPGAATGIANRALSVEGTYDYDFVEKTGHLLQIEKPQECVQVTLQFLAQCNLI